MTTSTRSRSTGIRSWAGDDRAGRKYTRVLGVNRIRVLVGAMDEKRAGRAILVTTSWFASGCWTKAQENGRIELIDGPRLRHLVTEHMRKDVPVAPPTGRRRDAGWVST